MRAWADSRQNSAIPGQRYLTEKTQKASQARAERDEFLKPFTTETQRHGELKRKGLTSVPLCLCG